YAWHGDPGRPDRVRPRHAYGTQGVGLGLPEEVVPRLPHSWGSGAAGADGARWGADGAPPDDPHALGERSGARLTLRPGSGQTRSTGGVTATSRGMAMTMRRNRRSCRADQLSPYCSRSSGGSKPAVTTSNGIIAGPGSSRSLGRSTSPASSRARE